ncbi:MAG: hypothetical protein AAFQ58_08300 [Pseudomonadota bacterium]
MTIGMLFPDDAYFGWWNSATERDLLDLQINSKENHSELNARLRAVSLIDHPHQYYNYRVADVDRDGQLALMETVVSYGWRLIAAQKMPEEAIQYLTDRRVAIALPEYAETSSGRLIEMNPVLMREDVADYIVARLARDLGARHDCLTLGIERKTLAQHLITGNPTPRQIRATFMKFALPCVIPEQVDHLRIGDYWEIRSEYKDLRDDLNTLINVLVAPRNLEELSDTQEFFSETEDLVNKVLQRVERQKKTLSRQKAVSVASYSLGVGTTLVSSLIDASYGAFASVATIFGAPVVEKIVNQQLDTLVKDDRSGFVRNTAMMSAEILARANYKPRELPPYMI